MRSANHSIHEFNYINNTSVFFFILEKIIDLVLKWDRRIVNLNYKIYKPRKSTQMNF